MEFEKDIERYLIRQVERRKGLCLKYHPDTDTGMPDRLILLPGGRLFWVELKRENGKLSQMQIYQQNRLRALGQRCFVVWSKEDVDRLLEME